MVIRQILGKPVYWINMKDRELIIDVLKQPLEIQEKDKIIKPILLPMTEEEFNDFYESWLKDIEKKSEIK